MLHTTLNGWNYSVNQIMIGEQNAEGQMVPADGWEIVFTEVMPPTGNTIRFPMGRALRDDLVRSLTGGIVLHGGELPRL